MIAVTFLWTTPERPYDASHVRMLANALEHYSPGTELICITDEGGDFGSARVIPTPEAARFVLDTPEGPGFPACYRRLWLFSEAARALGGRIMLLDLDVAVTGDLRPFYDAPGSFIGVKAHRKWGNDPRIAGAPWVLDTGKHTKLWKAFADDPEQVIADTWVAGWRGSDQAVISAFLAQDCTWFGEGIYPAYPTLPVDARLVSFNGHWHEKPWNSEIPWVQDYIRMFRRTTL